MKKTLMLTVVAAGSLFGATAAFAQSNENPAGLDYGPFHPPVPPQVTTYYPPSHGTVVHRRYHTHRPSY